MGAFDSLFFIVRKKIGETQMYFPYVSQLENRNLFFNQVSVLLAGHQ